VLNTLVQYTRGVRARMITRGLVNWKIGRTGDRECQSEGAERTNTV